MNAMVGVGAAASDGSTNHDRVKNNGRYTNEPDADWPGARLTQILEISDIVYLLDKSHNYSSFENLCLRLLKLHVRLSLHVCHRLRLYLPE